MQIPQFTHVEWHVQTRNTKKENCPSSGCVGGWTPYESMTMHQLLSSPCIVCRTLPLPILGPALSPSQSILTFLYLLPLAGSSCSIVAYMQTHVLECLDWLDRVIHVKWKVIIELMNFCGGTLEFLHQCCSLILQLVNKWILLPVRYNLICQTLCTSKHLWSFSTYSDTLHMYSDILHSKLWRLCDVTPPLVSMPPHMLPLCLFVCLFVYPYPPVSHVTCLVCFLSWIASFIDRQWANAKSSFTHHIGKGPQQKIEK